MTDHFVSVIIPSYNRAQLLDNTIRSFLDQTFQHDRYEIIVADNNSTDHTKRVVESYNGDKVSVRYHLVQRQGVHYARNGAAKIAKGDILYFTDDDMIADRNLLLNLMKLFQLDEKICCATGRVLPKYENKPPPWVTRCLNNQLLSVTPLEKIEKLSVTINCFAYSCHMAVRKDVFFQAGGFNPENTAGVWLGDGETGLCLKMQALGWLFGYTSESLIFHIIPPSRMTLMYLVTRLSNQANCDSCTEYRLHRNRRTILTRMLRRNTAGIARAIVETGLKILIGTESWHFIPARWAYFYQRSICDLKLCFDSSFRSFIERDNWFE